MDLDLNSLSAEDLKALLSALDEDPEVAGKPVDFEIGEASPQYMRDVGFSMESGPTHKAASLLDELFPGRIENRQALAEAHETGDAEALSELSGPGSETVVGGAMLGGLLGLGSKVAPAAYSYTSATAPIAPAAGVLSRIPGWGKLAGGTALGGAAEYMRRKLFGGP